MTRNYVDPERERKANLDPVWILKAVAMTGHINEASSILGLHPNSLRAMANRRAKKGDWHWRFALDAGLHVHHLNQMRRFIDI